MLLPDRKALIKANYPYGKSADGVPLGNPKLEWMRTNPDYAVYIPNNNSIYDTDNCQLHVFVSPDEMELLALWTQSSVEGGGDNRLVLSRSEDGVLWSEPRCIAGATKENAKQASWGVPVLTSHGRIYVLYLRETDSPDNNRQESGRMACIYSDDGCRTFSRSEDVPMPRSRYDNADPGVDKNWVPFQKPICDSQGRYYIMCTLYTSHSRVMPRVNWVNEDTHAFLIRLDNLETHPEPGAIQAVWLPEGDIGISMANALYPDISTAQEPSVVTLPDGRLFLVIRTMTGTIAWSVSDDFGATFSEPETLYYPDWEPVHQPLAPCPIFSAEDRYLLFFHNNRGKRLGFDQMDKTKWLVNTANYVRNPLHISICEYTPLMRQPLRIGKPEVLLDTEDVAVGPKRTAESATYSDLTFWKGRWIFWYPDRKFYLLGKDVTSWVRDKRLIDTE